MKIGSLEFLPGKRTYVMGILNVTPDSFSDGGRYGVPEKALRQAKEMASSGADIIDVGGESTRPGYIGISAEEEIARVVPIIKLLKANLDIPVSIDTYKPETARAAIAAGADMINDIWGLKTPGMAEAAAEAGLPCCVMHNRKGARYRDFWEDYISDIRESLSIAEKHGVKRENIILDPGIGFAKDYDENLMVLERLGALKEIFRLPVLVGASKKRFIGRALGDVPVAERMEGTLAVTALAIDRGADIVRVHDVAENKKVCLMADALVRGGYKLG